MGSVLRTSAVDEDLWAIGDYIAQRSGSVERALLFLDKIKKKCEAHARQPHMGEARPDLGDDVRIFPVGNYVVIYQPLEDGILVLMVTRGARDLPRRFRERFGSQG
jgi:toxin ParE1/3/4